MITESQGDIHVIITQNRIEAENQANSLKAQINEAIDTDDPEYYFNWSECMGHGYRYYKVENWDSVYFVFYLMSSSNVIYFLERETPDRYIDSIAGYRNLQDNIELDEFRWLLEDEDMIIEETVLS